MTGYKVWGMDGCFRGNENRVHLVLPALSIDGKVWLAREADWTPDNSRSGQWQTLARAEEVLTPLGDMDLTIQAGGRVVVVGSKYRHALSVLGLWEWWQGQIPCVPHLNGFWMGVTSQPEFLNQLIMTVKEKADAIYDAELRAGHTTPSELALAAFQVWVGTNSETPEDFVIRRVAHALWAGDEGLAGASLATGHLIWKLDPVECRKTAVDRLKPFLEVV